MLPVKFENPSHGLGDDVGFNDVSLVRMEDCEELSVTSVSFGISDSFDFFGDGSVSYHIIGIRFCIFF
jgi:hypothetical protein